AFRRPFFERFGNNGARKQVAGEDGELRSRFHLAGDEGFYLFCTQFRLTASKSGIQRAMTFVFSTYVTVWFEAPIPESAPAQDLGFVKPLKYQDKSVSKAPATVFGRHLCYLSEQLVALAFLDVDVTLAIKREMAIALREESARWRAPRDASPPRVALEPRSRIRGRSTNSTARSGTGDHRIDRHASEGSDPSPGPSHRSIGPATPTSTPSPRSCGGRSRRRTAHSS
ncbi:MAG: hypothetical protein AAGE98_05930, partial [Actinomycetota bacterium]